MERRDPDGATTQTVGLVTETVTVELVHLSGETTSLPAQLQYDPRDPYAVTMVFLTEGRQVRWTMGRELFSAGLFRPTGDGDVHLWPCLDGYGHAVVVIELTSPHGAAMLHVRSAELAGFLNRTLSCVAHGQESTHVDVDATIDAILAAATG